jgi:hyperosmotically inducible periplasmic protein
LPDGGDLCQNPFVISFWIHRDSSSQLRTVGLALHAGSAQKEEKAMNRKSVATFLVMLAASIVPLLAQTPSEAAAQAQQRIMREVRHELLMLPYFSVFDNISYKVEGNNVTLIGQVTQPTLKSSAGNVVKRIEGVEKVDNQIEVLPVSQMDDRLRQRLFRAIYGYAPLRKYDMGTIKPIRIIVKNGHVTLEGVVDNETDKNLAYIRANGVHGVFSVTNNLQVVKPA